MVDCLVGSRAQVMNGTCKKTSYGKNGLTKGQLKYNSNGKIVSVKASNKARSNKNLGMFLKKKSRKGSKKGTFELAPKKGTKAYKELVSKKSSKKKSVVCRGKSNKRCKQAKKYCTLDRKTKSCRKKKSRKSRKSKKSKKSKK